MIYPSKILAALLLFVLSHVAGAAEFAEKFMLGTPYYFNDFDPGQRPWEPGQSLSFEEVFKNFQYYEIVFDQGGKSITVNRYLHGSKENSETYLVLQDKSLRQE